MLQKYPNWKRNWTQLKTQKKNPLEPSLILCFSCEKTVITSPLLECTKEQATSNLKCYDTYAPIENAKFHFNHPVSSAQSNANHLSMIQLEDFKKYAKKLNVIVLTYFDGIAKLVNAGGTALSDPPSVKEKRCELHLTPAKRTGWLWKFCTSYEYELQNFMSMLNFVKFLTMYDVGKDEYLRGNITTPKLVLCMNGGNPPAFTFTSTSKKSIQYEMILSHETSTSTFFAPSKKKTSIGPIDTAKKLGDFLFNKILQCDLPWMELTNKFRQIIDDIPSTSTISSKLANGNGALFGLSQDENQAQLHYDSFRVDNCAPGSYYRIKNGIICSPPTSNHFSTIAIYLQWKFIPSGAKEPTEGPSETRTTILIQFACDVWNTIGESTLDTCDKIALKQEMLRLTCYNYIKFNEPCDTFCCKMWSGCKIFQMLTELDSFRIAHSNLNDTSHDMLQIKIKSLSRAYGTNETTFD
jgi:hypothetical protein